MPCRKRTDPSRTSRLAGALGFLLVVGASPGVGCQTPKASEVRSGSASTGADRAAPIAASVPSHTPQPLYLPEAESASGPSPAAAGASGKAEKTATAFRVAAVGDSLTDTRAHGGKYLSYLKERCPRSTFDNYGVGGEMVNQMRKRFVRQVLSTAGRYSHVIVFGGVNDVYSDLTAGRTPEKITRDLAWMYQQARDSGVQVVAINIAPWGGFRRYFNEKRSQATRAVNRWIQSESGADAVVDAYSLLSCGDPERLCPEYMPPFEDGLHFGKLGHEVLGKALFEGVFSNCK